MTASFSPVQPSTVSRAAQLTQKTNQFNATTRRYTEAELIAKMQDPDWLLTTVSVRDRFGDNGIVGLTMAKCSGDVLHIDTFLMSCRVIGRSIETAMLAHLANEAVTRRLRELRGSIIPTAKNEPVRDLYSHHGFIRSGEDPQALWVLPLETRQLRTPEWIRIEIADPQPK